MIDFTIETPIERPAGEVFAYVTDLDRLATWQTNTVSSTLEGPGPLRPRQPPPGGPPRSGRQGVRRPWSR